MMRANHFRHALAGCGLLLGLALATSAEAQQRPYLLWLDGAKLDIAKITGLPPAQNSPEAKAEFDEVLRISQARTPEREKAAIADQRQGLVNFLNGMDTRYVDNTHREVRLLFREAQIELAILLKSVHRLTSRPRPFAVWNKVRVKPCPGGDDPQQRHVPPEAGEKLEERVKSYDESRLVCGFHYPSDLAAGDKVGRAVAKALLADKAFKARYDETVPEIRLALGAK